MRALLLAGIAVILTACANESRPEPSEDESHLARTYLALVLHHERFGTTTDPDSIQLYRVQADSILASFGFTRDEFKEAFEELTERPERLEPLLRSISGDLPRRTGT